ncbi:hypothetical protein LY76DRAFT_646842 [Colletotrichum caudatum]|nr:hypothetical protein LY76DRAFT_646842 [Colletotrichum caudatum]
MKGPPQSPSRRWCRRHCAQYVKTPEMPRYASGKAVSRQEGNRTGSAWPYGPSSFRGEIVTRAGINWPMSGETMVSPRALEWASVDQILDAVESVGFNYIRMRAPSPP